MENINIYLSRILSGVYLFIEGDKQYKLKYPGIHIKYLADLYAQEQYDANKFNDWIHDDDILGLLISINLWTMAMEKELETLPKSIEDSKVKMYNNSLNPTVIKNTRKTLAAQKKRLDTLYFTRHSFDHVTVSGYAALCKNHLLLIESLYDINDNKVFSDINNIDFNLFNTLSNKAAHDMISSSIFRQIARSDVWRTYWSTNKHNVFGKPTIEWTDEQKTLVMITKMYDNAYEHPECPSDNIIEDDDMFDGWMISIRRESEKEKNKRKTEKTFGDKLNKAGEIFLVANSREEANNIYELNSDSSRHIIRERETSINRSQGLVEDSSLPDVQRELHIQQMQAQKNRIKK